MAKNEDDTVEDKDADEEDKASDDTKSDDDKGGDDDASDKKTDADKESDDKEDADKDKEGDDADDADKGKKSKKSDDDAEPEVPVRKVVGQQNIIARKNKTIKKLREEKEDEGGDDNDEEGDDDLIPSAAKSVQKHINKALAPVMEVLSSRADEDDLRDLYSNEPDAKKYDRSIRVYMKHPAYKGVAPSVIYHHLAFGEAKALGAKKKEVADIEANKNKGAGNTKKGKGVKGSIPSPEELDDMSDADFEKMQQDVLQGKYKA